MRRLDRILDQARLLRAKRAARAQGLIESGDEVVDWLAESAAAQAVLEGLAEGEDAPLDPRRRKGRLDIVRHDVLDAFVDRVEAEVRRLLEELDPVGLLVADMMPRACEASSPHMVALFAKVSAGDQAPSGEAGASDPRKARAALGPLAGSVRDAATLAVEISLFEVLRRVNLANDLSRRVALRSHTAGVEVAGGKVVRPRRDLVARKVRKAAAAERAAARKAGVAFIAPASAEALALARLSVPRPERRD